MFNPNGTFFSEFGQKIQEPCMLSCGIMRWEFEHYKNWMRSLTQKVLMIIVKLKRNGYLCKPLYLQEIVNRIVKIEFSIEYMKLVELKLIPISWSLWQCNIYINIIMSIIIRKVLNKIHFRILRIQHVNRTNRSVVELVNWVTCAMNKLIKVIWMVDNDTWC